MPDRSRDRAAEDLRYALDVLERDLAAGVADPDARRELRHVAAEPGVLEALGGPGLAGCRALQRGGGAGAVHDHVLQRVGDEVGGRLRDRPCTVSVEAAEDLPLGTAHDRQGLGRMVYAAARERRVRVCHLERVDRLRAERDRADRLQPRADAHHVRRPDDVRRADFVDELGEDRVHGVRGRVDEVHRPRRLVREVVHVPEHAVRAALDVGHGVGRRAVEVRVERNALVERGGEDERLERAAGLPSALRRQVELQLPPAREVADHRADGAGARVDRDERGAGVGRLREMRRDRRAGDLLQPRVDRRLDVQPARLDAPRAVEAHELLLDVAEEVRMDDLAVEAPGLEPERRVHGPAVLEPVDVARAEHRAQHFVPPQESDARPLQRVVHRRRLRQAGEQRRLRQCE